ERRDLGEVAGARGGAAEAPRMTQGEQGLAQQIGPWLARDGEGCDVLWVAARFREAEAQRLLRKPHPVLDTSEALFLDAGDEAAVHHRRSRRIGVERGETEDLHPSVSRSSSSKRASTTSRNQ